MSIKKYEYLNIGIDTAVHIGESVNKYAMYGWRIIQILEIPGMNVFKYYAIMEREIIEEEPATKELKTFLLFKKAVHGQVPLEKIVVIKDNNMYRIGNFYQDSNKNLTWLHIHSTGSYDGCDISSPDFVGIYWLDEEAANKTPEL
jgi:hypothetical protein